MNRQVKSIRWDDFRSRLRPLGQLCSMLGLVALLAVIEIYSTGCRLARSGLGAPRVFYECTLTLVNDETGEEILISNNDAFHEDFLHPDFVGCRGAGPEPISDDCPVVCDVNGDGVWDISDVQEQWRRFVLPRVAMIAGDSSHPLYPLFSRGRWCVREIRCRVTDAGTNEACPLPEPPLPPGTDPCAGEPPPPPPPPPGIDPCLDLGGDVMRIDDHTYVIDFGRVPVGETVIRAVEVINCGNVSVTSTIDERLDPTSPDPGDFAVTGNECGPRTAAEVSMGRTFLPMEVDPVESSCTFRVEFTPQEAGLREAQKTIVADVEVSPLVLEREFQLRGEGIPGRLRVDPAPVCFNRATPDPSRCLVHDVTILNEGPGWVTIDRPPEIEPLGSPYELVSVDPPGAFPRPLSPGSRISVRLRLCDLRITTDAALVIESNAEETVVRVDLLNPRSIDARCR